MFGLCDQMKVCMKCGSVLEGRKWENDLVVIEKMWKLIAIEWMQTGGKCRYMAESDAQQQVVVTHVNRHALGDRHANIIEKQFPK